MEVKLASCGNPDHFQDPDQPMYGCESNHVVTVNTIEEASEECKKFIKRNDLGGGNWIGGDVYVDNELIAKIAYNGRIFPKPEYTHEIIQ